MQSTVAYTSFQSYAKSSDFNYFYTFRKGSYSDSFIGVGPCWLTELHHMAQALVYTAIRTVSHYIYN